MNSASVDLIYMDPPFNSNATYSAPVGSAAAGAAFKDSWTLDDVDAAWHGQIADEHPGLYKIIDGAGAAHSKGMQAYLIMMGVRMIEMQRILRPTGSIYLHCDPTAGAYLKTMMDAVFGRKSFRNEIVWAYRRWPAKHPNFQRMHDTILRYAGEGATWNQQYEPLAASTRKTFGTKQQVADFSSGHRKPSTTEKESRGAPMRDVWNIGVIAPIAKERCGYPTQKPLSLLERIIRASSNEGDFVFDPFCGCATTLVAAEKLGRLWGGCRPLRSSRQVGQAADQARTGRTAIQGRPPHRHPQADGSREAAPGAVTCTSTLRRAGGALQGLWDALPVPRDACRSHRATSPWRRR